MKYINRHAEIALGKMEKMFSSLLITGARQVGKTTLLKHLKSNMQHLRLDDPLLLLNAIDEPGNFFKATPPPLILDEVQYAPQLFSYIKMIADESQKKGLFYLTGSQQFHMMKNVSESLAGRIGIFNLLGLSLREIQGISFSNPFIPTKEYINQRKDKTKSLTYKEIWKIIHQGSMPAIYSGEIDWQMFYAGYTRTYIERDVRELTQVGDDHKFVKFMIAIAARTSQMLNLSSVANDIGISAPTAERWLSILVSSNIVFLLQPYYNNITKRTVKTPKLYFLDTGLAAYLTRWNDPNVLEAGAMASAFFETFVVSEVLKSYYNTGILKPPIYYYRDKDSKEIDILIEENGTLYPIEIKKSSNPKKEHIKNFSVINNIHNMKKGPGAIVCLYENYISIDRENAVIPVNWL